MSPRRYEYFADNIRAPDIIIKSFLERFSERHDSTNGFTYQTTVVLTDKVLNYWLILLLHADDFVITDNGTIAVDIGLKQKKA